ncbi:MAG: DUF1667 domain-containing protein [Candidatus Cloacimonetes bacterium]|nr:DUF1667 domain-containing protein [Candidatus Cloacimonadota bacterium]
MAEYRKVTCILCPNACQLGVHFDKDKREITDLENSRCKRGIKYAMEEIFDPKRSVMTVVPIESKSWKVTSVLTAEPIPKNKIFDVYDEVKKVRLKAPVKRGDVLISNVCNLGVDIIITRTVRE